MTTTSSRLASWRYCGPSKRDRSATHDTHPVSRIVAEAARRLALIRLAEAQVSVNLARAQRLRRPILQAAFPPPPRRIDALPCAILFSNKLHLKQF